MHYLCNSRQLPRITAVIGILLMAGVAYLATLVDFTDEEHVLSLLIIGATSGLLFIVTSDLMRKTLQLQARIVKLEEQMTQLTAPPAALSY